MIFVYALMWNHYILSLICDNKHKGGHFEVQRCILCFHLIYVYHTIMVLFSHDKDDKLMCLLTQCFNLFFSINLIGLVIS